MQVYVHDTSRDANKRRVEFLRDEIADRLESLRSVVHRLDVTLHQEGHASGPQQYRCQLTASTGPMGTIVVDAQRNEFPQAAFSAIEKLTRGLRRRIGRRQKQRSGVADLVDGAPVR